MNLGASEGYISDMDYDPSPAIPPEIDIDIDTGSPVVSTGHLPESPNFAGSPRFAGSPQFADPPFPGSHSPSYNGSYNNSPFSGNSDLDDFGQTLFPNFVPQDAADPYGLLDPIFPDYDPNEYDLPQTSLLMFNDNELMSGEPGDFYSPSSHGGDHSRASSVSSNHISPSSNVSPSPRLDVAQSFESMTFQSPGWKGASLPPEPPKLITPPTINEPEPNGESNIDVKIVPATPVNQGGGSAPQRDTSLALQQTQGWDGQDGSAVQGDVRSQGWDDGAPPWKLTEQEWSAANGQKWDDAPQWIGDQRDGRSDMLSRFTQHSTGRNSHSQPLNAQDITTSNAAPSDAQAMLQNGSSSLSNSNPPPSRPLSRSSFLYPNPNTSRHSRSRSEAALDRPTWDNNFLNPRSDMHSQVMLSDHSPSLTAQPLGTDITDITPTSSTYLHPTSRSRSVGHNRQTRSEDLRDGLLFPPEQRYGSAQFLSPNSGDGSFGVPGLSVSGQSLMPQMLPSMFAGGGGREGYSHRRSHSGGSSRSERGSEAWVGREMSAARMVMNASTRASPYPSPHASPFHSPNASPRVGLDELPRDYSEIIPGAGTYGGDVATGADFDLSARIPMQQPGSAGTKIPNISAAAKQRYGQQSSKSVAKQHVTTGRTANASHKRRKQEATFVCPVAGCGSTFTRSFNLKGHMRSHNEEKPFQCHWPGCGKGFARQHDCKRHEQLHTNYRPFSCDGCHRQFARMDALNRHLRSEGGAECAKLLQSEGGAPIIITDSETKAMKTENGVGLFDRGRPSSRSQALGGSHLLNGTDGTNDTGGIDLSSLAMPKMLGSKDEWQQLAL